MCRDTPQLTQWGGSGISQILCKSELSVHTFNYTCIYKVVSPVKILTPTRWNLIDHSATAPSLCYHPAVVYFHFFHIALIVHFKNII